MISKKEAKDLAMRTVRLLAGERPPVPGVTSGEQLARVAIELGKKGHELPSGRKSKRTRRRRQGKMTQEGSSRQKRAS
jgi:hypothetical protein